MTKRKLLQTAYRPRRSRHTCIGRKTTCYNTHTCIGRSGAQDATTQNYMILPTTHVCIEVAAVTDTQIHNTGAANQPRPNKARYPPRMLCDS
eukprot:6206069-Pleurochrysis_carterae.AAC.3